MTAIRKRGEIESSFQEGWRQPTHLRQTTKRPLVIGEPAGATSRRGEAPTHG